MSFEMLRSRLMEHLRTRIQNGELTERSLARLSGISQPHIHNVLKGEKILSPKLEDQILSTLKMSILDLYTLEELRAQLDRGVQMTRYRALNVLDGLLGPGFPLPVHASHGEMHPVDTQLLEELVKPKVVRLGEDPEMAPLIKANQLAVLDYSEAVRLSPRSEDYFVVTLNGSAVIRIVRREGAQLFAVTQKSLADRMQWQELPADGDLLQTIRARAVLLE